MELIIAIDGYSACGKSTLAKQLAERLNYTYIDTGAMYRAITLYFLRESIPLNNNERITQALSAIKLTFETNNSSGSREIFLNGENVHKAVRSIDVSQKVSEVAAIKAVRKTAIQQQQQMGAQGGVVMDGRDIGTAVFPQADLKIFMTADLETRAQRRFQEMTASEPTITLATVKANLEQRDYLDTHRKENPLKQSQDAKILDNSRLTREQQLVIAIGWVNDIKGDLKATKKKDKAI